MKTSELAIGRLSSQTRTKSLDSMAVLPSSFTFISFPYMAKSVAKVGPREKPHFFAVFRGIRPVPRRIRPDENVARPTPAPLFSAASDRGPGYTVGGERSTPEGGTYDHPDRNPVRPPVVPGFSPSGRRLQDGMGPGGRRPLRLQLDLQRAAEAGARQGRKHRDPRQAGRHRGTRLEIRRGPEARGQTGRLELRHPGLRGDPDVRGGEETRPPDEDEGRRKGGRLRGLQVRRRAHGRVHEDAGRSRFYY